MLILALVPLLHAAHQVGGPVAALVVLGVAAFVLVAAAVIARLMREESGAAPRGARRLTIDSE